MVLTWRTASETDNAGFAVERRVSDASAPGARQGGSETWTEVGYVESTASGGTTSKPQRYRFTDAEVPFEAEKLTYRLRQKHLDGTTTLSDETTLRLGTPSETKLHTPFPNPARGQATLRYQIPEPQTIQIAVFDVLGRRVRSLASGHAQAGRYEAVLSTAALAPGTYFVRLQAGTSVQTRRLTVAR